MHNNRNAFSTKMNFAKLKIQYDDRMKSITFTVYSDRTIQSKSRNYLKSKNYLVSNPLSFGSWTRCYLPININLKSEKTIHLYLKYQFGKSIQPEHNFFISTASRLSFTLIYSGDLPLRSFATLEALQHTLKNVEGQIGINGT